jgi:hypothetical protein
MATTVFSGPALFDELAGYARAHTFTQTKLTLSSYLDVEIHVPGSADHPRSNRRDLTRERLIQEAHGEDTLHF